MPSTIFAIVWTMVPMQIFSLPYNGSTEGDFLTFVWQNSTLFNLWYTGEALTVVFALPLALALYFILSRVDKGIALIGTATTILGGFVYLSNVGQHFYLVQAATIYDGGCTVCAQQAITGATATSSVASSDNVAGYLVFAGILILSLLMFRSKIIRKIPGFLGLLSLCIRS